MRLGDNLYKASNYNHHHMEASMLHWRPPNHGFVRLNVNGALTVHGPKAACGGVIRYQMGNFQGAFTCRLKTCLVAQSELWAILHGINMARERGFML